MSAQRVRVVPVAAPEMPALSSATSLDRTIPSQFVPEVIYQLASRSCFMERTATRPLHLLTIRKASIYGPNLICSGEILLNDNNGYDSVELIRHIPDFPLRRNDQVQGKEPGFTIEATGGTTHIDEACYLHASENYAAWLFGELPRVFLYEQQSTRARYLLHGDARPFHFDSLRLLGIDQDRITKAGSAPGIIEVGKLTVVTPTYYHHTPTLSLMGTLRDLSKRRRATKRIYVSRARSGSGDRRIRNEVELEKALESAGIEIVHPETLTFDEQMSRFSECELIIAPFGAALANLAFAPENARLLIIGTKIAPEFLRLSLIANLQVTALLPTPHQIKAGRTYSESYEYEVSINELVAAVK